MNDASKRFEGMPQLAGVTHRSITVDGLEVHVAEAGTGDPIVLQHGWPQNWWAWRELIPSLATRYRVICPDMRGLGWSGAPPDGYEKEQLATDLLGVLDALDLDRVRLVGHDWGGFAGFLACMRAPERFSRFVALSILHPWPRSRGFDPKRVAGSAYQFVLSSPMVGRQVMQRTPFVPVALRASRAVGDWDPADLAIYRDRFREPARAAATVALYRTFLLREIRPILAGAYAAVRLEVPALLIAGSEDTVLDEDMLSGFEEHAEDMSVRWIEGAGHWLPEEAPDAIAPMIEEFLA